MQHVPLVQSAAGVIIHSPHVYLTVLVCLGGRTDPGWDEATHPRLAFTPLEILLLKIDEELQVGWEEDETGGVDVVEVVVAGCAERDAIVDDAEIVERNQALSLEPFELGTVRLEHRSEACDLRSGLSSRRRDKHAPARLRSANSLVRCVLYSF